jgi:hypothetical protein
MADKKISQLSAASTPLAGTEVLPIVQSSATVKVAANDLTVRNLRANSTTGILQVTGPTAGTTRIMTAPDANFTVARTDAANSFTGDQTLSTGNLIVGTAGKGIDFSANTNAAGMTSELLSDYEEGNWTPVVAGLTTPGTYETAASQTRAKYVKINNVVYWWFNVLMAPALTGGGSGYLTVTGLPFAVSANTVVSAGPSFLYHFGIALAANEIGTITPLASSSALIVVSFSQAGGQTVEDISVVAANGYLRAFGQYWTA